MDQDLAKILTIAGVEPAKATDHEITMADRAYMIFTMSGITNHQAAAIALKGWLQGPGAPSNG